MNPCVAKSGVSVRNVDHVWFDGICNGGFLRCALEGAALEIDATRWGGHTMYDFQEGAERANKGL